jgi:DHA1 family bicyclomycin/chloramphenicol resistance-like MFS transporter
MMLAAFVVGGWVGTRLDASAAALTQGIGFWSVCIALVAWTLVPRYGEFRRI